MKKIRNETFETNSSSSHSLGIVQQKKGYKNYTLTDGGYIIVKPEDFWSESDYRIFDTIETKLTLIFAMIATEMYDKKYCEMRQSGKKELVRVTKEELLNNKYIREIKEMLKKEIPNCKGFRFAKNSFASKTTYYTLEGNYYGSVDTHHFGDAYTFGEYLEKNHITLHDLVMNPSIVMRMNVFS